MNHTTRTALCWMMTVSLATAAAGAVMGTSPGTTHRVWIAGSLALLALLNGYMWWMLQPSRRSMPGQ